MKRLQEKPLAGTMIDYKMEGRNRVFIKKVGILCAGISLMLSILFNGCLLYAAETEKEEKYSYIEMLDLSKFTRPIKKYLEEENISVDFFASIAQGYDNNVNLDSSRDKDGFLESFVTSDISYNYSDDIRLRFENDVTYLKYYKFNEADLFDIYNRISYNVDLFNDRLNVNTGPYFEYVLFPFDEDGTYIGYGASGEIVHYILERDNFRLYQSAGYIFLIKHFTHEKISDPHGNDISDLREDYRNTFDYEISFSWENFMFKLKGEYYVNDSNDMYEVYYDYYSYRLRPMILWMITDNFYTIGSFSYQQRHYDGRISTKNGEHVYDETFTVNASIFYEISPSFTLGVNCLYRENISNEPLQKYSGSIVNIALYYTF